MSKRAAATRRFRVDAEGTSTSEFDPVTVRRFGEIMADDPRVRRRLILVDGAEAGRRARE